MSLLPVGDRLIRRSHLQRAALAFGGVQAANPNGPAYSAAARSEKEKYSTSTGGTWNYEDLIWGLNELARGGNPDNLERQIRSLTGLGEVEAKLSLLEAAIEQTPLLRGTRIEVGARQVDLGDGAFLRINYDISIKVEDVIYCYLIYPRAEALKSEVRSALIREFCTPFSGMSCPHKLNYVENPKVKGRRVSSVEEIDFEFLGYSENFRAFLRVFAKENEL